MIKKLLMLILAAATVALTSNALATPSPVNQAEYVRTIYSSTPVNTATWTPIVTSLAQPVTSVTIFDSSGQTMALGIAVAGAAPGAEVQQVLIPPGGASIPLKIGQTMRVSIKAVSGDATTGENDSTFFY